MRKKVHTGTLKLIPSLTVGPRPWEERRLLRGACSTRMPSRAERAFSWFILNAELLLQLAEDLFSSIVRYADATQNKLIPCSGERKQKIVATQSGCPIAPRSGADHLPSLTPRASDGPRPAYRWGKGRLVVRRGGHVQRTVAAETGARRHSDQARTTVGG